MHLPALVHLFLLLGLIQGGLWLEIDLVLILIFGIAFEMLIGFLAGKDAHFQIQNMKKTVMDAFDAILIFMLLGPLIASWIAAGSIPFLIEQGFSLQNTSFFLAFVFVICSLGSLITGTSWGTIATLGFVLLLMGESLGIPKAMLAGAIVGGAFLGDKMSPISDSTNLAAANVKIPVRSHILAMSYSSIPAFLLALIAYVILGWDYPSTANEVLDQSLPNILQAHFSLSFWTLLPILVLIFANLMRYHAVVGIFLSLLSAILISVLLQEKSWQNMAEILMKGYNQSTGFEIADQLLLRGGLIPFAPTLLLCMVALCFGALVGQNQLLEKLISPLLSKIQNQQGLLLMVLLMGFLSVLLMGEIYLGILLTTQFFLPIFEKKNIAPSLLSRLTEESATLLGPLIPWTTAGIFAAGILGVKPQDYLWFCFFNLFNVLISMFWILFFRKNTK